MNAKIIFRKSNFLVIGRAGMDLYATPVGTRIEEAQHYHAALGGSAANIAVAIVKGGGTASLATCVSDDAIGRFVRAQLAGYGVECDSVFVESGEARNSLAVVETRVENCQAIIYRNNAADFQLTSSHICGIDLTAFGGVVITGTSLACEPSRSAVLACAGLARAAGIPVIFDIDYRRYSWNSLEEASVIYQKIVQMSSYLVGNEEEFDVVAGKSGAGLDTAKNIAAKGAVTIYKMGGNGSLTFTNKTAFETPVFKVEALKPTGAGDAFLGTFCASLARGNTLEASVRRGSAAAAIVVTKVGCAPATPNIAELDAFMAQHTNT